LKGKFSDELNANFSSTQILGKGAEAVKPIVIFPKMSRNTWTVPFHFQLKRYAQMHACWHSVSDY